MQHEVWVEIELDYRRVLVVPLDKLTETLGTLLAHQYAVEGYGKDCKYRRLEANDLPDIRLVSQDKVATARLLAPVSKED